MNESRFKAQPANVSAVLNPQISSVEKHFEKNDIFSVNPADFCQLMWQSMPTYLATGNSKSLISNEVECHLLWHLTHKLLTTLFPEPGAAVTWLTGPHEGFVFTGQSPLMLMLNGTQGDLFTVKRFLEVWPHSGQSHVSSSSALIPVTPLDINFL
ncbi:hypothetical protein [Thalassospira sp.]|uniref:hypothetical protein n=1 Tax=Thalassospira sp. TaxID=1912094 RepID=UPI0032ED53CC